MTGNNNSGELGDGTNENKNSFVQVIDSGVKEIAAGGHHSLILKEDGSLWGSGWNVTANSRDSNGKNTFVKILNSGVKGIAKCDLHSLIIKEKKTTKTPWLSLNGNDGSIDPSGNVKLR